ncbi:MAG: hypothetical protein B6I35_06885 [Anaerolineaceae bacterium 4572_32.2]|nr:MAG: hypothetical protein B6I35_06885 [Anaerolineaceae bacterium 4572_32.2]
MAIVEKTAKLDAPVEKTFNLITDLGRWPEWVPPLTNVANVSGSGMGSTYDWEFKLGHLPAFSGTGKVIEFAPNERFGVQTKGIPSKWLFKLTEQDSKVVIKGITVKVAHLLHRAT